MRKKLSEAQQKAIERARMEGLSPAHKTLINALDAWFDEQSEAPTLHDMIDITGLKFGTILNALPVLEHFGYVVANRNRKGRLVPRGVVLLVGFDYRKDL